MRFRYLALLVIAAVGCGQSPARTAATANHSLSHGPAVTKGESSRPTPPANGHGDEQAEAFAGYWEGAVDMPPFGTLHMTMRVYKADDGHWTAAVYAREARPDPLPVDSVAFDGRRIHWSLASRWFGDYDGELAADGLSIVGHQTIPPDGATPSLNFVRASDAAVRAFATPEPAPKELFVEVDRDVRLEVLDWGGAGRPIILLSGSGDTAHVFRRLAPKLVERGFHVYAITRRGFGNSSKPDPATPANYTVDRLGEDVLDVMRKLSIEQPILVGHSLGGQELSAIGSGPLHDKVAGLVYLDAAYAYAFYDDSAPAVPLNASAEDDSGLTLDKRVGNAISAGARRFHYRDVHGRILAFFAPSLGFDWAGHLRKWHPDATVIEPPNATHYVYQSNEAEVLSAIAAFAARLK